MRKRIGLFLGGSPDQGGTFQYNLAVYEAVVSLCPEKYSSVFAYQNPLWRSYLVRPGLEKCEIPRRVAGMAAGKLWVAAHLPAGWWRSVSHLIHPVARSLVSLNCDLWIFPSQDSWSHRVRVPALVAIHDLMHRYEKRFPEVSGHGEFRRREWNYSQMCKWVNGVLVDSGTGKQHVCESYGMPPEKIHVLPYTAPGYLLGSRAGAEFDARYNLPGKYFFYPAHFWRHKNHKLLLEAVAGLKRSIPDIGLVLVGRKKNGYSETMRLIEQLGLNSHVRVLGYVPDHDMAELYRRARALVMPSFLGPTNIPPLEAFVLGCPAAVSRVYGMAEQVGDAALLFNPESLDEITECLVRLWVDDRLCADLSYRGNKRAAGWSQEHFNRRLEEIIGKVTGVGTKGERCHQLDSPSAGGPARLEAQSHVQVSFDTAEYTASADTLDKLRLD